MNPNHEDGQDAPPHEDEKPKKKRSIRSISVKN
jgi:hypothetical protein